LRDDRQRRDLDAAAADFVGGDGLLRKKGVRFIFLAFVGCHRKGSVVISWSAQSRATRYDLTQTDVSSGGGATTVYSGSGTSTVITLGAPINRVLDYSARACNSAGCSDWVTGEADLNGSGTPMAVPAPAGNSGP
jgi:hypothetical protein